MTAYSYYKRKLVVYESAFYPFLFFLFAATLILKFF